MVVHDKFHPHQLSNFCGTRVEAEQEEEDNDDGEEFAKRTFHFFKKPFIQY